MRQFPKTQLRTLQFDSFFIENVKKVQDTKKGNLAPEEAYWLYHSESKLHEFVKRATLDTKIAILSKLDVHYSIITYDDVGCDRLKLVEQISAARGLESAEEWRQEFSHYSHLFIVGDLEVQRILNRLQILHHSKFQPISRYIKRLRDFKRLENYESLLKEGDFIYFLLKVCIGYTRIAAIDNAFGMDKKELAILVLMYLEHRPLTSEDLKPMIDMLTPSYSIPKALKKMAKQKLIDELSHPYNRGKVNKRYSYSISVEGQSVVLQICSRILSYL